MTDEIRNSDKKRLLQKIVEDIRDGSATLQDYQDYERILKEAGEYEAQIRNTLKKYNLQDWEAYIQKRKAANTYEKKRETEVLIAGALVGIALAAMLLAFPKAEGVNEG